MRRHTLGLLLTASIVLASCGGKSVIDKAKEASLAECPGQEFGDIVNGYFITGLDSKTLWTAYRTDDPEQVRITAEGNILYVGIVTKTSLEALYNESRNELKLSGVKFTGKEQPLTFAKSLVSNMCDKAKGLD